MTTRHRTMVWGTLLALALLGVAAMPVAWAMPAQQLGTVPTRTPTPGPATNTPVLPPTSAPVEPSATEVWPDPTAGTPTVEPTATVAPTRPTLTRTAKPAPPTATSTVSTVLDLPTGQQGTPVVASPEVSEVDGVPGEAELKPDSIDATATSAVVSATGTAPLVSDVPSTSAEGLEETRTTEESSPLSWELAWGALLLLLGGGLFAYARFRR